ncbi:hypothetical protein LBMAG47_04970 [Planctomycetia bacterium]|nr:hypothetical protein LBMAG47_04970 [Planctomycetia bacterium]
MPRMVLTCFVFLTIVTPVRAQTPMAQTPMAQTPMAQTPMAQGTVGQGVSVTASGEVRAKPNAVEIDVTVAEGDARAGDALGKYAEAKKRLLEACGNLKLATLAVEERAIEVTAEPGQPAGVFGPVAVPAFPQGFAPAFAAPANVPEIRVARTIRLTLRGIRDKPEAEVLETIGTILDAVRDAGGTVGPSGPYAPYVGDSSFKSVCRFVLEDAAELRKKAAEAALAQARTDAGALAGGRVGPLVAVSAGGATGPAVQRVVPNDTFARSGNEGDDSPQRLTSPRFTEIPVRVGIQATFRLLDP